MKKLFHKDVRGTAVSPILKLCVPIRFLAGDSYQKYIRNDFNVRMTQSTMFRVIKDI